MVVHSLPLPVQIPLQNQVGELGPVSARLDLYGEVVAFQVGAQGVGTRVRVLRALQREARARRRRLGDLQVEVAPRERGRVVVHVQNLHLDPVQFQRGFDHDLQVQETSRALLAQLLAVDLFIRPPRAGHQAEAARGQLGDVQTKVLRDVPDERAVFQLLGDGVAHLRQDRVQGARAQEQAERARRQTPVHFSGAHRGQRVNKAPSETYLTHDRAEAKHITSEFYSSSR
uniref:Uncharacterized protein n=1 Tax=Denticeps clupeoides TaxID=299321 RepID=A0AAY4DKQ0_9TELE